MADSNPVATPLHRPRTENPIFNANKLKLGIFGLNGKGTANTTAPEVHRPEWKRVRKAAQLADVMGLEAIVAYSRWKAHEAGKLEHQSGVILDPFTWAAGIAEATQHAGVFATSHAPTIHPVTAAKMCATIDIISEGRFGLNIVAGWNQPELEMFGAPLKEHDKRYDHLAEWLEIIKQLWTSDEEIDFDGEFFKIIKGASRPKPYQRPFPPIMNAGSSGRGRDFALEAADMCFVQVRSEDPEEQRAQVDEYKRVAREKFGREVQVWMMANIFQRDTNAEAEAFLQRVAVEYADNDSIDAWAAQLAINTRSMTPAQQGGLRLRAAAGAGGSILVGDADRVAEQLQGFSDVGIDGVLIGFVDFEAGLPPLRDGFLPRLGDRGRRLPFRP